MAGNRSKIVLICPLRDSATLLDFVEACLRERVELIAVHGPGCETVHDEIDALLIGDGSAGDERFISTTWHGDESLEEVVEFASAFGSNNGIVRQVRL